MCKVCITIRKVNGTELKKIVMLHVSYKWSLLNTQKPKTKFTKSYKILNKIYW